MCMDCEAGKYSEVPGSVTCFDCPAIEGAATVTCSSATEPGIATSCDDGYELEGVICVVVTHPPDGSSASPAIDCTDVALSLPCHIMLLVDEVRNATSLQDIDKEVFCPCERVRAANPEWSPRV